MGKNGVSRGVDGVNDVSSKATSEGAVDGWGRDEGMVESEKYSGVGYKGKSQEKKGANVVQQPISFRDKLLGAGVASFERLEEDLVGKNLASVEMVKGCLRKRKVSFAPSVLQRLSQPWQDALVVKLLGKHIMFHNFEREASGFMEA